MNKSGNWLIFGINTLVQIG